MKTLILSGWNAGRILRAVAGVLILASGIGNADVPIMIFGGFFLLMSLLNVAPPCCAGTACSPRRLANKGDKTVVFEELDQELKK